MNFYVYVLSTFINFMNNIILAWIFIGLIAVFLSAVMLYGLWTFSGFSTVALLFASAFVIYISLVIACIFGERFCRFLNKKR